MILAIALALASPEIFLRTQVQGWTISNSVLSCRAEKKVDWFKSIAILKAKDDSASLFLTATEYGSSYFGDVKVDQPQQRFDIYFTKGFNWEPAWKAQRAEAMLVEGKIQIMTTVAFSELAEKASGGGSMVFMQTKDKMASFLILGLPEALVLLDRCSKTLR